MHYIEVDLTDEEMDALITVTDSKEWVVGMKPYIKALIEKGRTRLEEKDCEKTRGELRRLHKLLCLHKDLVALK